MPLSWSVLLGLAVLDSFAGAFIPSASGLLRSAPRTKIQMVGLRTQEKKADVEAFAGVEDYKAALNGIVKSSTLRLDKYMVSDRGGTPSLGDPDKVVAKSGGLSKFQMDAILELTTQALCEDAREDREKLGLFGALDNNMDGYLSVQEFKPFAKNQGVEVDDQAALQGFFNLFDTNKDGVVSQSEFFAWFAKKEEGKEVIKNADDEERLTRGAFTKYLFTLSFPWVVLLGYQKVGAGKKSKDEPNMFDPTQLKDKPLETAFTETTFEAVTNEMYNQDYTDTTKAEAIAEKGQDVKVAVKQKKITATAEQTQTAATATAEQTQTAEAVAEKGQDVKAAVKQKKITATAEQTKTAATATAEQTETAATAADQKKLAATAAFGAAAVAGAYSAATRGEGLEAKAEITKTNGSADSDDIKEDIPLKLPKIELPNAGSTLPSGWSKATDPSSGNTYYYNEKGETQWDVPN